MLVSMSLYFMATAKQGGRAQGASLSGVRISGPYKNNPRVHRVANAAFWRTFQQQGKISPGW
jgi:hypothetical protein